MSKWHVCTAAEDRRPVLENRRDISVSLTDVYAGKNRTIPQAWQNGG